MKIHIANFICLVKFVVDMSEEVVIVGGARTPFVNGLEESGDGKPGGLLKAVSAQDLGATAIRGLLKRQELNQKC